MLARSTLSSERNRCSVLEPVSMFTSRVCTMPRQLPGVTCRTFVTRCGLPLCMMTLPTLSWVAAFTLGASGLKGRSEGSRRRASEANPSAARPTIVPEIAPAAQTIRGGVRSAPPRDRCDSGLRLRLPERSSRAARRRGGVGLTAGFQRALDAGARLHQVGAGVVADRLLARQRARAAAVDAR